MNARTTALSALIAIRRQNAWADGALKEYIARDRLSRRDAALAAAAPATPRAVSIATALSRNGVHRLSYAAVISYQPLVWGLSPEPGVTFT